MAINTRVKGWKNMDRCRKELQSLGYLVDTVEKTGRFHKQKDLFGLFDIVAIKKGEAKFIQITTNKPHKHKPYQEFGKKYHNNGIQYWQWVHYDRRGWVKYKYLLGNKIITDERKVFKNNKKKKL